MTKTIKDDCRSISIHKLKEWGVLEHDYYGGSITWTSGYDQHKTSVSYVLNLSDQTFTLDYRIKGAFDDEWSDVNQTYPLTTTSCRYGGKRWWFICSVYNRKVYCGRRVAKLYLGSGSHYFACRNCYDLSYQSRNENRRGKFGYMGRFFDLSNKIEELEEKIKIRFRAGQPTKKFLKLMRMEQALGITSQIVHKKLGKMKQDLL